MSPREIGWLAVLVALLLALTILRYVRSGTVLSTLILAILTFALGIGLAKFEAHRAGEHMMVGEATTRITGVVERATIDARGRTRYTIRLLSTSDPNLQYPPRRARLFVSAKHETIPIGGELRALARLRQPSGPARPNGYDFAFHNYFDGLGAHGFVLGRPEDTTGRGTGHFVERFRAGIARVVRAQLPPVSGGVAAALLTGDRRGIPDAVTENLRASGLAHVLAISGLHMALVSGFIIASLRIVLAGTGAASRWPTRKIAASAALAVAGVYLFLSGFGVSAQRAFVMLAVILVAVLFDRPALTMRNVGLAAIVIIAIHPHEVLGPGFQMSFGATAALIAVYGAWKRLRPTVERRDTFWLPNWARTQLGFIVGLAVTSLVAGVATSLFAAYHFQRIAPFGLIANLAAMPIVTFVTMPSGVLTALLMPFGLEQVPLAVMGWSIDRVVAIADWVAGLRSPLQTGEVPVRTFVFGVVALFLAVTLRTRIAGVVVVPLAIALVPGTPSVPSMLVVERGEMVGIVQNGAIRVDRSTPNRFLAEQWADAYGVPVTGTDEDGAFRCDEVTERCRTTAHGLVIATLRARDHLGEACDTADIVVTAFRTYLERCRSGAWVLNAITTNRRGSAHIDLVGLASAVEGVARDGVRSRLRDLGIEQIEAHVNYALPSAARPWTAHRHVTLRRRRSPSASPE